LTSGMIEWIHLEERISDLMIIAQSKCLAFDLGKVQFLELYLQVVSKTVVAATLTTSVCRIRDNFLIHLSKGSGRDFIRSCHFGYISINGHEDTHDLDH
jgi:hypothetical protein